MTVKNIRLTKFESDLVRLIWISNRCRILYNEYPVASTSSIDFSFQSILREYIILQLHNFILIRKDLLIDFQENGYEELDLCLEPFWGPIFKHETTIRELRNKYFAHMQEKERFKKDLVEILSETKFPAGRTDSQFFAGCVWGYSDGVRDNCPEYRASSEKHQKTTHKVTLHHELEEENLHSEIKKAKDSVKLNLQKAGYVSGF